MILRPYQRDAISHGLAFIGTTHGRGLERPHQLYYAPTGTGKGTIQLTLCADLRRMGLDSWIVSPSLEIIRGFLERSGLSTEGSQETLAKRAWDHGITTPVRLQNRILSGEVEAPDVLLVDEVHEWVEDNEVPSTLFALCPIAPKLGYTATPFRGTPRGTRSLRETWGEAHEIISIEDAVAQGYLSLPTFDTVALVDDDKIKVVNGEFQSRGLSKAYANVADRLAEIIEGFWQGDQFDKGTVVSIPDRASGNALLEVLEERGVPAIFVHQGTPAKERRVAYDRASSRRACLIQIRVLSRGVDLPELRRLIDAQPTMSPVLWLQTVGRVTRPHPVPSEVIVTNRNLGRYAYLLEGMIPARALAKEAKEFGTPSKRACARVIGLEQFSRHKPVTVPLWDGRKGSMFFLERRGDPERRGVPIEQICVILIPGSRDPFTARREKFVHTAQPGDKFPEVSYGRWGVAELPDDVSGWVTSSARAPLSKKQRKWWERAAERKGLDPYAAERLTMREFNVLPVLSDCKVKLR